MSNQPRFQETMTPTDTSLPLTLQALLRDSVDKMFKAEPAELIAAAKTDLGIRQVTRLTLEEFESTVGHIGSPMIAAAEGAPSLVEVRFASGNAETGQALVLVASIEQVVRVVSEAILQKVAMELTHRESAAARGPLIDGNASYSAEERNATWSRFASLAGTGLTRTLPSAAPAQG